MSTEAEVPPVKKTKIDDDKPGDVSKMDFATASQSPHNWNEELQKIKESITKDDINLEVIRKVLVDVHHARKHMNGLTELVAHHKENLNESFAEKFGEEALNVTGRLDKVHSYLMAAFSGPMEIVLHKAVYGKGMFALDLLPDFVVGKILDYLDFQDKKNLREVCKRLAEVVILEDPSLRQWTIPVDKDNHNQVSKHLAKARAKGITDLANFQIHFQVYSEMRQAAVVKKWKYHVTGLKTIIQPSLESLSLPKLEVLNLYIPFGQRPSTALQYYIRTCGATLKNLQINGMMYLNPDLFVKEKEGGESPPSFSPLSGLQSLTLNGCFEDEFKMNMLSMCSNITHLDVGVSSSMLDIPDESLQLPALKHLRIEGSHSFRFLMNNTSHLETLVVSKYDGHIFHRSEIAQVPENLPKLKTFVCLEHELFVLQPVLQAAQQSLENLVVSEMKRMRGDYKDLNMEKLQCVVLSCTRSREDDAFPFLMECLGTPVLEYLTIFDIKKEHTLLSFNDNCKLPSLKDFCVYVDKYTTIEPFSKCKPDLEKLFPRANFAFDRREFEPYLQKFVKKYCDGF
eukprot:TRINITY_DN9750_c0_g1_i5.p1 TRINITY_DN9750_c0_g1~~TRINITY_DN9750_c0_g1_i5.p1  ORF type:complete len:569 (-),score=142.96 TRINITY_DN9750_c0_g1_i5:200-1906(-)